jgi:hypothetical protein
MRRESGKQERPTRRRNSWLLGEAEADNDRPLQDCRISASRKRQARQASQAANDSASVSGEKGRQQLSILGLADLSSTFSQVVPAGAAA